MKKIKGIFGIGASKTPSRQSSFSAHGYDLKEKDLPKIHKAAWTGDLAKVKQLAKKDPSALDKENRTPMHLACAQGHADIVEELLAWNARTDAFDSQSRTPLMKAVECNQEGCVVLLLERKKDLNAKDVDHNTALHLAVLGAPAKVVSLLINSGADVNVKNKEGLTPLMLSARDPTKRDDMTRLLLEGGANPNAVDNNKKSALHHACIEDNINHVKLLLQHKADTSLTDSKGWTAEDCAMMKAHHGCCQIIFDHNLKIRPRQSLGGSVPNTPRAGSIPATSATTPRDNSMKSGVSEPSSDLFGHPQGHQDADEDSDDQTISHSKGEGRQDSWADDTDVSSAMDDGKLKGKVKISLAGRVKLSDEENDDVAQEVDYENTKKPGGITRPMLSRTPTPDADLRESPQVVNGPKTSSPSKIPLKKQTSGASNTSVDEDLYDDSDDDEEDFKRRVSFSNKQDVRNITDEDDTDIEEEEDEEEEVPPKKPKMADPQDEEDGYVPTAIKSGASAEKLSQDKFQASFQPALMHDLGLHGTDQYISDEYDDDDDVSEGQSDKQQPNTPRGILKKSENGRPPSNQMPVESDEEESAWDSTGPSEGNQSGGLRNMNSPEVDSDLENTLNPEKSQAEKTSQWDSTDEGYTPRNGAAKVQEEEVENEDDEDEYDFDDDGRDQEAVGDHIHEQVTSFSTRLANQASPLPSDSPPRPGSHDTSTRSTSAQRTVVAKETVVVKQTTVVRETVTKKTIPAAEDEDEENSEWDSEDEVISEDDGHLVVGMSGSPAVYSPVVGEAADTPPVGADSPVMDADVEQTTPRNPRDHTTSTVSDEESMSEWERERRQQKEEEAEKLRELEEEEERQRQWEEEEARRRRQLEREAEEELEREHSQDFSSGSDFSEGGDHLPDSARQPGSDHSHLSQNASQQSNNSPQVSLTSPRARELKKPPPKLRVTSFIKPAPLSPRTGRTPVQLGEIENESPALFVDHDSPAPQSPLQPVRNVGQFAMPSKVNRNVHQGMNDDDSDVEVDEIEDEISNDIDISSPRKDFTGDSPLEDFQEDSPTRDILNKSPDRESPEREFHVESPRKESPVGRFQNGDHGGEFSSGEFSSEEDENEADNDIENVLMPITREEPVQESVVVAQSTSRVMATTSVFSSRTESAVPSVTFKADDNESPLLGKPPPLPVSAPPSNQKAMSLRSDGQSADDDDVDLEQPVRGPKGYTSTLSQFPDLSGTTGLYRSGLDLPFDDDGLSVTSTENGDISSSYRPENLPYGKDMLVNMNLNDSSAVLKLQEHLREHRKQLEYERGQKNILEEKQRQMNKDRAGLQKSVDSLKYQKTVLEQNKLDLEAKIRQLEYQVSDEEEKKKNAELLLKKTKEQLSKKEEQYTQEMEARQRAELAMRNVQMELRTAQNQMKDLEDEKVELERKLSNEISARQLQEKINEEQQRLQQHIHEESLLTSSQREEARTALELADDDIKHTRDLVEKYKNEIIALKAELQKQRLRLTEENVQLASENDKLQARCEDLRSELKNHEEALTQYTVHQNLHQQKLSSDINMLRDSLDKEHVAREKNEAELESVRTRLQTTTSQLEKSQQARNDLEKRLHGDRDEWARQLERKEAELSSMKDKVQAHIHALNSMETKLNSVENELQISNTTLLERTNQYHQAQREMQHYKTSHDNHDANLRHEKEINSKLQAKVESLQDRLSGLQHENLTLKQQVDTAQQLASDRAGYDLQDKLNTMIASLKADHDKARANLEEKNNNLQDTITRLREEIRNSENRRSNLEQDIRRLNQEQNELVRKLSMAEASLDVTNKSREHLEQERAALKIEIEKLQAKYNTAQEKTIEAQTRMGELVDRLDRTEQSRLISSQQLADTSATMHAFNMSKAELEENYQKLQVDNVRLDAELKHEKQKTDMLQRDLADSQKVRSSLEALCSNLKSTNAHLEEKLGPDQLREVTASIAQLERHKQETATHLEEEKRRTRKALQEKKLAESKLESEQEKCQNLQKEVANLKAYLKVAKKRLRDPDSDNSVEAGYTEKSSVEEAKKEIEARYRLELNRKLDEVNNYLEEQARTRQKLDLSREEQEKKLRSEKKKIEEEVTDLRLKYEQAVAKLETKDLEARRYRDLYESEMQWRMRLSEQVYHSTDKAFTFKNKLVAERQKNRLYGSMNNVNGHVLDLTRVNGSLADDALSSRLRAELDRSIAKHLEAAPHDKIHPLISRDDPVLGSSNFAKASADYIEVLKQKYCV